LASLSVKEKKRLLTLATGCPAVSEAGKYVFTAKNFLDFGPELRTKHFVRTSLTGNEVDPEENVNKAFDVDPMSLEAVRVQF